MGRLSVTLDEDLLEDARKALGAKTKRETIVLALEQARRRVRQKEIIHHSGKMKTIVSLEELLQLREQS